MKNEEKKRKKTNINCSEKKVKTQFRKKKFFIITFQLVICLPFFSFFSFITFFPVHLFLNSSTYSILLKGQQSHHDLLCIFRSFIFFLFRCLSSFLSLFLFFYFCFILFFFAYSIILKGWSVELSIFSFYLNKSLFLFFFLSLLFSFFSFLMIFLFFSLFDYFKRVVC